MVEGKLVLRLYNFCPIDIEIAKVMEDIRRLNRGNCFKLIRFEEVEEVKTCDKSIRKTICRQKKYCASDCSISYITSVLTYGGKNEKENFSK